MMKIYKYLRVVGIINFSILAFVLSFFFIESVLAQSTTFGVFSKNIPVNITQTCFCSDVNITSIITPDGSILSRSYPLVMHKRGNQFSGFILEKNTNASLGTYLVSGVGNPNGQLQAFSGTFDLVAGDNIYFKMDITSPLFLVMSCFLGIIFIIFLFRKNTLGMGIILFLYGLILFFNGFNKTFSITLFVVGAGLVISAK